jgi:ABC-type sugar transport system substrate-binding protein
MDSKKLWTAPALLAMTALVASGCGSSSSSSDSSTAASTQAAAAADTTAAAATTTETTKSASVADFPDYDSFAPPNFVKPTKQLNVAALIADTSLPLQKSMVQGWQDGAKEYGVKLTVYDAGGFQNSARQVSQMETAIGTNPDAMIILPTSPVSLNAQIAQAKAKGIPVIGELIPPTSTDMAFSFAEPLADNGEKLVNAVSEKIGGKGKVFLINGGAGGAPDVVTTTGMKKALAAHPDIEVVFEKHLASFDPAGAQQAAENALVKNPDVAGVITNSTTIAQGATAAMKQAGKNDVVVSGIGPDTAQQIEEIRSGKIAVAITEPFYKISKLLMQWAVAIPGGAKPPAMVVPVEPMVFTPDNIDQAISSGKLFDQLTPTALGCGPGQSKEC